MKLRSGHLIEYAERKSRKRATESTEVERKRHKEEVASTLALDFVESSNAFIVQDKNPYLNQIVTKVIAEKQQLQINERKRTVLIDWMVEICKRFKLSRVTFRLAVVYLDLYLRYKVATNETLQKVGCAALTLACKQYEIYFPSMDEFVHISDAAYSTEALVEQENLLLDCISNCEQGSWVVWYRFWLQLHNFQQKIPNRELVELWNYFIDFRLMCNANVMTVAHIKATVIATGILAKKYWRNHWTPKGDEIMTKSVTERYTALVRWIQGKFGNIHFPPFNYYKSNKP